MPARSFGPFTSDGIPVPAGARVQLRVIQTSGVPRNLAKLRFGVAQLEPKGSGGLLLPGVGGPSEGGPIVEGPYDVFVSSYNQPAWLSRFDPDTGARSEFTLTDGDQNMVLSLAPNRDIFTQGATSGNRVRRFNSDGVQQSTVNLSSGTGWQGSDLRPDAGVVFGITSTSGTRHWLLYPDLGSVIDLGGASTTCITLDANGDAYYGTAGSSGANVRKVDLSDTGSPSQVWNRELLDVAYAVRVSYDQQAVFARTPTRLYRLNAATGAEEWVGVVNAGGDTNPPSSPGGLAVTFAGDVLCWEDENVLRKFSGEDAEPMWNGEALGDTGWEIEVDGEDNIYTVGNQSGFWDGTIVRKYSPNGDTLWTNDERSADRVGDLIVWPGRVGTRLWEIEEWPAT